MPRMKSKTKLVLYVVAFAALYFGYQFAMSHGMVPAFGIRNAMIPQKANLPDIADAKVENVEPLPYPTTKANGCTDTQIRSEVWAWNSQMGMLYANGGVDTTKGSLMEKYGVCLHFQRQDDTSQMATDLLSCAQDLKDSSECAGGVHFITIMADGSGQFFATLNPRLAKICKGCTAEIVGTSGFSRGEDKLMGPEAWKRQPRLALGDGLIAGVIRDGDWDTAQKWAADNNLKNNPDEKTYDASALNWVNAADYVKAAEMYVAGYCEDRSVIKDGHLTGEKKNVCVKAIVTWTPGDVVAAHKKGGIVTIVSTKQYRSQMPSAIIGIKKWDKAHPDKVAGMLAASLQGGDQVKAFPDALTKASDISAKVYGEQNGEYWMKYYKGVTEKDSVGKLVDLGGSYADNMNDALTAFGLAAGANNNVKATYTVFAKIVDAQYHDMFTKTPIPTFEQVSNTSYLLQAKGLLDNSGSAADAPQFNSDSQPSEVFGDKNWDIEFSTGSAKLTQSGLQTVKQIKDEVAITGLTVILNGHTDNTGSQQKNKELSAARAESVKQALEALASSSFPDARFRVNGYGDARPIADNSTAAGRTRNRRVEVILAEQQSSTE